MAVTSRSLADLEPETRTRAAALRELWGIGPSDEWLHPFIFGDLYVGASRYTLSIYHQPAGPTFTITGSGFSASTSYSFGRVSLHIPGENL